MARPGFGVGPVAQRVEVLTDDVSHDLMRNRNRRRLGALCCGLPVLARALARRAPGALGHRPHLPSKSGLQGGCEKEMVSAVQPGVNLVAPSTHFAYKVT